MDANATNTTEEAGAAGAGAAGAAGDAGVAAGAAAAATATNAAELAQILAQFDPLSQKSSAAASPTSPAGPGLAAAAPAAPAAAPGTAGAAAEPVPRSPVARKPLSVRSASSGQYEIADVGERSTPSPPPVPAAAPAAPPPRPAEDLPFDFQRFLDQLRQKGADPIARYLKSFLQEFKKRSWTVREQVRIVQDFQNFIGPRISQYPPFVSLPASEISNAIEGMEKLVMNRLYTQTFSPEIPRASRSFSHEEDLLRDKVLEEKMGIWSWIEGEHLDLDRELIASGDRFIVLAQDELLKINNYRAPRDKVICILNCCKVIFGLLRQTRSEESADRFLPILIYVVIKAQPRHLISNTQYIMRFRNPDKLNGENGYYLSSLQGAISFIETLDRSALNITDEEFEERIVQSVARIAEKIEPGADDDARSQASTPERSLTSANVASQVQAIGTTLSQPFKNISKFFDTDDADEGSSAGPVDRGLSSIKRSLSTTGDRTRRNSGILQAVAGVGSRMGKTPPAQPDAATRAAAEERQARKIQAKEHKTVVQTLFQMFPNLDLDVIDDVVTEKQGRVGAAVDACLALMGSPRGSPKGSAKGSPKAAAKGSSRSPAKSSPKSPASAQSAAAPPAASPAADKSLPAQPAAAEAAQPAAEASAASETPAVAAGSAAPAAGTAADSLL
ncbi:uncharacterized protein V1510DRAFT_228912 [Dipodascopsis tothii]|uniref:uncharacterized protein n=1 Tax=Dipodascopsis tothii TaxID=44089 RepID=UPI0034CF67DE